jgi:Zn-dependent oligopeptidase
MSSLIKTIICVFALQLCYAQTKTKYPSVIVIEKDTLVCFNTEQSKQIAVWNEQRKECVELRSNDNQKMNELKNINTTQTGIIYNLEKEVYQYKKNIEDKDKLIGVYEDEKKSLKKEVRTQKIGKWIAIIGGVVLSTLCLTL